MSDVGARITDAVNYYQQKGELRGAVRAIRNREPERLRWRSAVGALTQSAGRMRGIDRMRVEEPIREVVLDMHDDRLRTEIVLDARRNGVDFDRGEVLPVRTMGDLRRYAFLTRVDLRMVHRYVKLPLDFHRRVDVAGVVIVGRAMAHHHRQRAHRLWLELPDPDGPEIWMPDHRAMNQRAEWEMKQAERWTAFAKAVEKTGR
ncbi:MAG: hypothetical protein R3A78_12730 [Polyangiales bacterium]|nr:hypothetical protein [Myxococcales bacterium]